MKDRKLHADMLQDLTKEISERRYGGKRFYLRILNCIFFDAFERCGIPPPPLPHWSLVVDPNTTRNEIYKKQLRAWNGFTSRAFAVLMTVSENTISISPGDRRKIEPSDAWLVEGKSLPPISQLQNRGKMLPMNEKCMNEEKVIDFKFDWTHKDKKAGSQSAGAQSSDTINLEEVKEKDNWESPACICKECKVKFRIAKGERFAWARGNGTPL